jgi:hypothetical protein
MFTSCRKEEDIRFELLKTINSYEYKMIIYELRQTKKIV